MASTLRMRTIISTPVVAAIDSCFVLIRTHQHGIATGEMSHIRSSTPPFNTEVRAKALHPGILGDLGFIFVLVLSQFRGSNHLGAWNRLLGTF